MKIGHYFCALVPLRPLLSHFREILERRWGYISSNGINLNTSDRNARGE